LPTNDTLASDLCGECSACLKVCPTDAFPRPYELDARRCISYLTIENKGPIPEEFRTAIGNRVFGCDDCQAICPWNKFAHFTQEDDFRPRHGLADSDLLTLFLWDEPTFLRNTEGSAIRRVGYERWQRNLAVGLGNAPSDLAVIATLEERQEAASPLVREHIEWALQQQRNPQLRRPRKLRRPRRR
jgi:epoxyqueuosine reductase